MSAKGYYKTAMHDNDSHVYLHVQVEEEFMNAEKKGCPVAGVLIEPIQAEGGENVDAHKCLPIKILPALPSDHDRRQTCFSSILQRFASHL